LDEVKQEVKKMEAMYNLQKEKGGIIDLEAEKNKYLLRSVSVNVCKLCTIVTCVTIFKGG